VWTQRDQIQAYQFLRRRLVSALVSADANHPASPSKRLVLGVAIGAAVALLTTAVFGVIGLLSPSRAEEWRQGGQVIVEKETGARYVLGDDGALHPVLNYASARLLAGGDGAKTVSVPAKSLAGTPRGVAVGIPGAPDSLPQNDKLLAGPWTRCSRISPDRPSGDAPISTVLLGQSRPGVTLRDGQGVLVRSSGGLFVLAGGQRHRLVGAATPVALGYTAANAIPVAPAWLTTVAAGRDLQPISVQHAGKAGPAVGTVKTRVGQVLATGAEYYVVRDDGLAVVTETEALLVLGTPANASAYPGDVPRPTRVAPADVAAAPQSDVVADGYPRRHPMPVVVERTATLCATGDRITVGAGSPGAGSKPALPEPAAKAATEVYVPGGGGAVVEEQPAPGVSAGAVYVITDTGMKYPVTGDKTVAALGFGTAKRQGVPAAVLDLFPTGVTLNPDAARKPVSG
jgi:type VII secretion protein EccB